MRIVLMVPIYAIISFLSYRFYREAIYYETIRDCYEAFVIHSFFTLLLTYLGDSNEARQIKTASAAGSDHKKLVIPLNCFYYNPQSPMFLYKMKYGILQYVVVKPVTTIAAVVLQYYGLYCATSYSFHFGNVYIMFVNFISVTVAMYCLVVFYQNIKLEIAEYSTFMHSQRSSQQQQKKMAWRFICCHFDSSNIFLGIIFYFFFRTTHEVHLCQDGHFLCLLADYHSQCFGLFQGVQGDRILVRGQYRDRYFSLVDLLRDGGLCHHAQLLVHL